MNIKKRINLENVLCVFLIICPILDSLSFMYRNIFNTSMSPSTFIRPIIPIMVIIYIFFKDKIKIPLIIGGGIYAAYAAIHMLIYKNIMTQSSYGTITHELQYIVNYSYMILNLFIYTYIFRNNKDVIGSNKIKKSIFISMSIYVLFLIISIITKTSSHTYMIEGIGYKGWFESGNALSAILILSTFVLFPLIRKYKVKITILLGAMFAFLMFVIGTRVRIIWLYVIDYFIWHNICIYIFYT